MPGAPGEIDPFQDKGEAREESLPSFRLKIAVTVAAGVLAIITTAAVVIALSLGLRLGPDPASRPVAVASLLPVLAATPTAATIAPPTATQGPSRRPPSTGGSPAPTATETPQATGAPIVARLESLSCTPSTVTAGTDLTCQVTLTAPAPTDLTIDLISSDAALLSVPPGVTIAAGAVSASFTATPTEVLEAITVTITATLGAQSATDAATVQPTS